MINSQGLTLFPGLGTICAQDMQGLGTHCAQDMQPVQETLSLGQNLYLPISVIPPPLDSSNHVKPYTAKGCNSLVPDCHFPDMQAHHLPSPPVHPFPQPTPPFTIALPPTPPYTPLTEPFPSLYATPHPTLPLCPASQLSYASPSPRSSTTTFPSPSFHPPTPANRPLATCLPGPGDVRPA